MAQFNGKNDLGARDLMLERSIYNGYVLTLLDKQARPTVETLQIKDFQKDERLLIGRIDHQGRNPVFPSPTYLKAFRAGTSSGMQALNFVVDSFEDMKSTFNNALRIGQISQNSQALSNLQVSKAYASPLKEYDRYLSSLTPDFRNFVKRRKRLEKISDFRSFVPVFIDFIKMMGPNLPITRSMYFLTKHIPSRVSGLVLEIYDGDYGDDTLKTELFYSDRNFEYFKNLAYSHGFMIDKHIPWRLVADMNSPRMASYITNSMGIDPSASSVLAVAFRRTFPDDIPTIIRLMMIFYNDIATYRPRTVIKESGPTASPHSAGTLFSNCKNTRTIYRSQVNSTMMEREYDSAFWLDLYARIRNIETNLMYSEGTLQEIINRSIDLLNSLDRQTAMGYIITKFDNIEHFEGSLFHDVTRLEMSKDPSATEASVAETVRRSVQASNFVVY